MNPNDAQEAAAFAKLLTATAAVYGKPAPEKTTIRVFYRALERYTFDEIRRGFNAHIQNPDNGQFFPKPADVIRQIGGDTGTQAANAWTAVDYAVRTTGPYQSVVFDDPITHRVIDDMGGWIALCNTTADEYPFKANEFKTRYRGFVMNPPAEYARVLTGIADAQNRQRGLSLAAPVLIGNPDRAALVFQGGNEGGSKKTTRISFEKLSAMLPAQQQCIGA